MASAPLPRLTVSVQEAADMIGVNPITIHRWIKSGRVRAKLVGRRRLVDYQHLLTLLDVECPIQSASNDDDIPEPSPTQGDVKPFVIQRTVPISLNTLGSGVYFLFLKSQLVYIGESYAVMSRIEDHRGLKDFDEAMFFPCPEEDRRSLESALIRALKPSGNGRNHTGAYCAPVAESRQDDRKVLEKWGFINDA